jgi:two-component system cell cycle sensor histidine kinase/response regulator CckA
LQDEKERLGVTLDSIADAVVALDADQQVVLMNRSAERLCGTAFRDVRGRPAGEVLPIHCEGVANVFSVLMERVSADRRPADLPAGAQVQASDATPLMVAGTAAPICDRSGKVAGVVLACRDVTAQHRREAELATLERLESLGVLAGGIAHDFNNILTAILGNASLLRMEQADADTETGAMIREIESAALRAKNLTQQLLTFSKGGAPVRAASSLGTVVRESAAFALRGAQSRSEVQVAEDLWTAEVDAAQIGQVIHHLVANADHAMGGGGVVKVALANVHVTADMGLPLTPGPYVRITVADTGVGIPAAMLGRIFDPYFTTKPKGSGLGLSTSYSIVRRHGGHISVESTEGLGSQFSVYLPALGARAPVETAAARTVVRSRGGRILVMDDEDAIRRFVRRMLLAAGYEVTEAADGGQAVQLYQEAMTAGQPFDAAILDLTVSGGMGGRDAMTRIRSMDPAVRALVSSGYSTDAAMGDYRAWGFSAVVAKPYQAEELLSKLEDVLSRS